MGRSTSRRRCAKESINDEAAGLKLARAHARLDAWYVANYPTLASTRDENEEQDDENGDGDDEGPSGARFSFVAQPAYVNLTEKQKSHVQRKLYPKTRMPKQKKAKTSVAKKRKSKKRGRKKKIKDKYKGMTKEERRETRRRENERKRELKAAAAQRREAKAKNEAEELERLRIKRAEAHARRAASAAARAKANGNKRPRALSASKRSPKAKRPKLRPLKSIAEELRGALAPEAMTQLDKAGKKTIKHLLMGVHDREDISYTSLKESGLGKVVHKLGTEHSDEKVKKWATGISQGWAEQIKAEREKQAAKEERKRKKKQKQLEAAAAAAAKEKAAKAAKKAAEQAAHAAAPENAGDGGNDSSEITPVMQALGGMAQFLKSVRGMAAPLDKPTQKQVKTQLMAALARVTTADQLRQTGLGKTVNKLQKHGDPKVKKWAAGVCAQWRSKFAGEAAKEAAPETGAAPAAKEPAPTAAAAPAAKGPDPAAAAAPAAVASPAAAEAPAEAASAEAIPAGATPGQAAPAGEAPTETAPVEAAPAETTQADE